MTVEEKIKMLMEQEEFAFIKHIPHEQPLAYSELTGTIYICYGREKIDVTEQAVKMVKAVQAFKTITYTDCANAMMMMWLDKVLTDGEYNRIMDKLNAKYKAESEDKE